MRYGIPHPNQEAETLNPTTRKPYNPPIALQYFRGPEHRRKQLTLEPGFRVLTYGLWFAVPR